MFVSSSQYQSQRRRRSEDLWRFSRVVLGSCEVDTWYPDYVSNGEEVDAIYPSTADYLEQASGYYSYSPGLVYPDAYETAGIFAVDGSSASVTLAEKTRYLFRLINATRETATRTFDYFGETTTSNTA
ncbi:hypothetical protein D7B24_001453 [Verticillium nonalfalfae]|uniref:Uncharacterized protein n=1 Tax=Verticillium nonalfalfae TaxID=1051616 RepID=A0A3M9YL19_9PEZI|nr:uncharacterized protein D7B24_001453 [Verticillium nonalfalfae]RNJ59730.1 hypothetical protein D7B24_001453 [Verticillium nonalfalfae]